MSYFVLMMSYGDLGLAIDPAIGPEDGIDEVVRYVRGLESPNCIVFVHEVDAKIGFVRNRTADVAWGVYEQSAVNGKPVSAELYEFLEAHAGSLHHYSQFEDDGTYTLSLEEVR